MQSMAFVCWNRFLDISEAIEEGDLSSLENTDFENTDVPFDIELPTDPLPVSVALSLSSHLTPSVSTNIHYKILTLKKNKTH